MKTLILLTLLVAIAYAAITPIPIKRVEPYEDQGSYIPIYVMLPLDVVNSGGVNNPSSLASQLSQLRSGGVDGVMVDVWWGLVENSGPGSYNWDPYKQLFDIVKNAGLKVQAIMSFHRCGGNVGDTCNIPLPSWVLSIGNSNPDIYYTDREGNRDTEYLSSGVDHEPIFRGRTAVEMYRDFMGNFSSTFSSYLGNVVAEVHIGLGPAGELRYPSYQLDKWSFCGVGEFQCYDKYLLKQLADSACASGRCDWGYGGPSNSGTYNSNPYNVPFFSNNGGDNWQSPYGQFFLGWYSNNLIRHADDILAQAQKIYSGKPVKLFAKVAGIHWWFLSESHAAELTAGYFNTRYRDGYTPIAKAFLNRGVGFDFTCLEMRDTEQPSSCQCGPQELVNQVENAVFNAGNVFGGENALPRYDNTAYQQIESVSRVNGHVMSSFAYLRLTSDLLTGSNWSNFVNFVNTMHNM